jgi:UDP-N-acetylglucosamine--dolichyl-phosphate N-acetylglucosaminephosphotransferase
MLDLIAVAGILVIFLVTFAVTFITTPIIAKEMAKRGITGKDIHKRAKNPVPEMCGLAILLGLSAGAAAYVVLFPSTIREVAAFVGTFLIAGAIGIRDDLRPLGARVKPLLTAIACLPILILRTYKPLAEVPLVGTIRLTLIYPFLVPVALAVTANAVNMMDVMNGSMPGTVGIISAAAVVILLLSGQTHIAALAAGLLAAMLAFYHYNRFPAKVFDGDTGSLAVGAAVGAIAILGSIEAAMVVALIPHIMNAFSGLASVGGLYERRQIRHRPTSLRDDGKLEASVEKAAPVTLTRMMLAAGPLGERDLVRGMMILTLVSSILAIFTFWITAVGRI